MKTKNIIKFSLRIILIVLFLFYTGCEKEKDIEEINGEAIPLETKIPETTKTISDDDWEDNFITLDTSDYTFTFEEEINTEYNFETGDILVSGVDEGYLRKITNVQIANNQIIVQTTQAALTEAIENGETSFTTVLSEQNILKINYLKDGVILDTSNKKSTEQTKLNYDIDTWLNDEIHIEGNFSILPSISSELVIRLFQLKKFQLDFEIEEELNLNSTIGLINEFTDEIRLSGITFQPIVAMIGPVPVVIIPELEFFAGVILDIQSDITTSINQQLSYNTGILYQNSDWTTYNELNRTFTYSPPTISADAEATVYIKPQLSFKIYGTVSPYLAARLYAELDADVSETPWWTLYAGVMVEAGVEMEIFNSELFDYVTNPPLIDIKIPIADASDVGNNQAPALPTNPFPANNAIDQAINPVLSWTCSDPDNDPLTYDVYFGTSSNPPVVNTGQTDTTFNPGTLNNNETYYWKIVAKDDHDNSTEGTVWSFSTSENSTIIDYDGNIYQTVQIGNQIWMAENLKTTHYANGTEITLVESNSAWDNLSLTDKAYCYYDNSSTNGDIYGALYTWTAAMNGIASSDANPSGVQGVCPNGWHIPSDEEWTGLTDYLGGTSDSGGKMKETGTEHWCSPNTSATNESGFTALPGGRRHNYGTFALLVYNAYFWCATEEDSLHAWFRGLGYDKSYVFKNDYYKTVGISVRCVMD